MMSQQLKWRIIKIRQLGADYLESSKSTSFYRLIVAMKSLLGSVIQSFVNKKLPVCVWGIWKAFTLMLRKAKTRPCSKIE